MQNLKAELINIEALYDRLNDGQHIDQRNEALALLKTKETFYNEELAKEQGPNPLISIIPQTTIQTPITENKPNIAPNTLNQMGQSNSQLTPLILIVGLAAAILILK